MTNPRPPRRLTIASLLNSDPVITYPTPTTPTTSLAKFENIPSTILRDIVDTRPANGNYDGYKNHDVTSRSEESNADADMTITKNTTKPKKRANFAAEPTSTINPLTGS